MSSFSSSCAVSITFWSLLSIHPKTQSPSKLTYGPHWTKGSFTIYHEQGQMSGATVFTLFSHCHGEIGFGNGNHPQKADMRLCRSCPVLCVLSRWWWWAWLKSLYIPPKQELNCEWVCHRRWFNPALSREITCNCNASNKIKSCLDYIRPIK